ncbi:putative SF3A3 domain-containing protein [Helianthus anomalus]
MFEHTVYGRELIQKVKPMIYREYIHSFPGLHPLEERHKRNRMYKRYMKNMLQYLTSFLTRAMPMIEVDEQMECGRRGQNIPLQEAQINGLCRFLDGVLRAIVTGNVDPPSNLESVRPY